jgi:hypothetical protein
VATWPSSIKGVNFRFRTSLAANRTRSADIHTEDIAHMIVFLASDAVRSCPSMAANPLHNASARLVFEAKVQPDSSRSIEGDAPLSREIHTV